MKVNLNSLRAQNAAKFIGDEGIPNKSSDEMKKYRSVLLPSVTQIRQIGLLQLAAFWLSKRDTEHLFALKSVLAWLKHADSPVEFIRDSAHNPIKDDTGQPAALFASMASCTPHEIALLEAEAEAILEWLRRLIEGTYKAKKEQEERTKKEQEEKARQEADAKAATDAAGQPPEPGQ